MNTVKGIHTARVGNVTIPPKETTEVNLTHPSIFELHEPISNSKIQLVPEVGGTITSFKVGPDQTEILCSKDPLSKKMGEQMGIPFMFPFCNRVRDSKCKERGIDLTQLDDVWILNGHAIHGVAYNRPWKVEKLDYGSGKFIKCSFDTRSTENNDIRNLFGKATVTLIHKLLNPSQSKNKVTLSIDVEVRNVGGEISPISFGFHPFFYTPGGHELKIKIPASDYYVTDEELLPKEVKSVIDTAYNFIDWKQVRGSDNLWTDHVFTSLDFAHREIGSEQLFASSYLESSHWLITIRQSDPFKHFVLYTPLNKDFVCAEPQTSSTDAFNFSNQEYRNLIILESGKTICGQVEINVQLY